MQNRKGISLIVLVITIIVMIVLAGAIVLSLNNSGIIDRANEAVDKTNEAQLKQIAQLGWAEAYAEYGADLAKLKEGVNEVIAKNNIDISEYGIAVTTKGVTVVRGWAQEGLTVNKGGKVIDIGDTIDYDETNNGAANVMENISEWQVLGASDSGELLILSKHHEHNDGPCALEVIDFDGVAPYFGSKKLEQYAKGKSATGARSITLADINKTIGYETNGNNEPEITFYWGGLDEYDCRNIWYQNEETSEWDYTAEFGYEKTYFKWYDDNAKKWNQIPASTTATDDNKEKIITLKLSEGLDANNNVINSMDKNSKAYKMLFDENIRYVLDSTYSEATNRFALEYGAYGISRGKIIKDGATANCIGYSVLGSGNVLRVVVSLSTTVNLTPTSTGWAY